MIFQAFISILFQAIMGLFSVLPNVPATPQAVVDGGNWIVNTIVSIASVLQVLYTPALLTAIIAVTVALFSFERAYHAIIWVVKKLPLNIH